MKEDLKIEFEAPAGQRLHRYFFGVIFLDDYLNIWWNINKRRWEPYNGCDRYANIAPCNTIRAYKRMLRKNPVLVGNSRLVNNYKGYDAYSK